MKRRTSAFLKRAQDALSLAIELFNRPADTGRLDGVLFSLDHAFEMLLKAAIFEKTGRIRGNKDKFNYDFEKCVNVCQAALALLDRDQALVLRNINGFRDAAVHDIIELSEGLLYSHAQTAVLIFAAILKKAFNKDASRNLPRRILPIATAPPAEITTIISDDLQSITKLLEKGKRRAEDAEAKLRPYIVIESNLRSQQAAPQPPLRPNAALKALRSAEWKTVLPMVAGIVQATPGGIPISLHLSKRDGIPVRIDPQSATAVAFKYIKPEDKYPYLTGELARRLKTTRPRVLALVKLFRMRGDDNYHTSIKAGADSSVQRYSEKARQVMAVAIDREGVDELWSLAKAGKNLEPTDYSPKPPATTAASA